MDQAKRRATGSYYTSADTALFMSEWLLENSLTRVLEPSAGDGVFINALFDTAKQQKINLKITAVELEIKAYKSISSIDNVNAIHSDFHVYKSPKVEAAIGNPPFVRFRNLPETQAAAAERSGREVIGKELDISGSIWMTIILHSLKSLEVGGKIAYVIPSDALYVRYAKPFWKYICENFGEVKVLRCEERLFPEILQDVVLLFAKSFGENTNEVLCEDFQTFANVKSKKMSSLNIVLLDDIISGNKPFMKIRLNEAESQWFESIQNKCQKAINISKFNIGYVSGNKSYFHPTKDVIAEFKLPSRSLLDSVVTARKLAKSGYATSQLNAGVEKVWLPNISKLTTGERKYIEYGEQSGFASGHKTGARNPWYLIPGVVIPDVMLTVFGELPRLIVNDLKMPASNSILIGRFKVDFPTDEFLMLWYSSITRLGIELSVHALGGGVLVLVPREADSIMMPKPIGKRVPISLLKKLKSVLESNDLESAYEIGDKYLATNGWSEADLLESKRIAVSFKNRRIKKSS